MNGNVSKSTALNLDAERSEDLTSPDFSPSRRRLLFLESRHTSGQCLCEMAGHPVCNCPLTRSGAISPSFWAASVSGRILPEAIDAYTFRFLFASTTESNESRVRCASSGSPSKPRRSMASKNLSVPLKVDQFPFASTQDSIRDLNFVRFDQNWAAGFAQLLALLEREGAPSHALRARLCYRVASPFPRLQATGRRREQQVLFELVQASPAQPSPVSSFHGAANRLPAVASSFTRPYRVHGAHLVAFANGYEIQERFGSGVIFAETL